MAEPYLAEIKIIAFNFPPRGWAYCDGQILPITQNQSLFSLLGTTYGGDGRTSFALPDLRGRAPMHVGTRNLGAEGGEENHILTSFPNHNHTLRGSSADATDVGPAGNVLANVENVTGIEQYANTADVDMATGTIESTGTGQAHQNMQPYLVLGFCIALTGLFPSRN